MEIKAWILLGALIIYLIIVIPALVDNHKTIRRIEKHYQIGKRKKGNRKKLP